MEYKYGMKNRGFSPMCQPMDGLLRCEGDPTTHYYDVLVYDRELTDAELYEYELESYKTWLIYRTKRMAEAMSVLEDLQYDNIVCYGDDVDKGIDDLGLSIEYMIHEIEQEAEII